MAVWRRGQVTCLEPFQQHRLLAHDAGRLDTAIRGVL